MFGARKTRDRGEVFARMCESPFGSVVLKNAEFFANEKYTAHAHSGRMFANSWFPSFPGPAWDRFLAGVQRVADGGRSPLQADVVVTGTCHCRCWHCFRSRYSDSSDLPLENVVRFLAAARELGTVCVGITGGEPMLRPDLLDVLAAVPEGMEAQLYTTGHRLTAGFLQSAERTRLTRCLVSLDHHDPVRANARRGYAQAFDEALGALRLLSGSSLYTAVSLCVTEDLCQRDELMRYFEFARGLGVDEIRALLPIPQGNLQGREDKALYLDAARTLRALRAETLDQLDSPTVLLFCEYESASCFGCGAGSNYVSLNNDGNVTPCVAIPLSFGNVKAQPFEQIYAEMARYFRNSGRTCYGRKVGRAVRATRESAAVLPMTPELSLPIAERHVVDGRVGDFFRPFRASRGEGCGHAP